MSVREITLEWVAKAEEDASVSERESRVRKQPSPGAVCYPNRNLNLPPHLSPSSEYD